MVKHIDSGIDLKSKAHYKTFGKFIINMNLLHGGTLLVKYESYAPVYKIKRTTVSTFFVDFLANLLDTGVINLELFKKLTFRDNKIFENLITRAKLANQLGYYKIEKKLDEDQLKVRFEVLRGQLLIGNDNEDIIEELIHIINELFKINKISEQDKNDLINSLN
jgi:hypothetical protein